ncbi:MAG: hypothetical protein V4628_08780 [Pseudomonadota bacterium]
MKSTGIALDAFGLYDLRTDFIDDELKQLVIRCIDEQKKAAQLKYQKFVPDQNALAELSHEKLQGLLGAKQDIHGIATNRSISNVITFGEAKFDDSIIDQSVETTRKIVDARLSEKLQDIFAYDDKLSIVPSGHFWYPAGAYMGWHTNSRVPGWRIYINYAEENGKSFFRYKHHLTGEIVTLWDEQWNMRVFRVTATEPLWHCVYSNTNRFSLGYMVKIPTQRTGVISKLKKMFA